MSNLPGYLPLNEKQEKPPPYTPSAPDFAHPVIRAPGHHSTTTVVQVQSNPQPSVLLVGGCPSCRVGILKKSHCTCCGVLWSILLFPIGLLCLLCCTKDRCTNCSYVQ